MKIFPKLQAHIDAALADPKPAPDEPREDFAAEARAEVSTPKRGQR
jgi:hypothetical protein